MVSKSTNFSRTETTLQQHDVFYQNTKEFDVEEN